MAAATSPASGQRYGVQRVCQVWGVPRSSFYAASRPKPAISDETLLAAVRKDLALSPWTGEGHRKVWARLRFIQPDEGGRDVFVHISAVERSGLRGLAEGQKVSYELQADRHTGKESAANLKSA